MKRIYQYHKGLHDCHYVFKISFMGNAFTTSVYEFEDYEEVEDFITSNIPDWDFNNNSTHSEVF